jgi:hypothetical protein
LLGAAIAVFLLWPTADPQLPRAIPPDSGRAPITASASDPHLIVGLPVTTAGNAADRLTIAASLADLASELSLAQALLVASRGTVPAHLDKTVLAPQSAPPAREAKQLAVANTGATMPPAPAGLPNPHDPGRSFAYAGRDRVAEEKFPEMPCTGTRVQGYRGPSCNTAVDEVVCNAGSLAIEANTSIFDPYANRFSIWCYVAGHPEYGEEDFQGMNRVTRRGSNWRNLISNGEDKSIEFFDGQHNCVAVQKAGPRWQRGYIYIVHASICRTDTAAVRAEDVAYALDLLHVRE